MLRIVSIFAIFVLLAVSVFYFIFRSPFFRLTSIEINGSRRAEEVKRELIGAISTTSKFRFWLGPENLLFWSSRPTLKNLSSLFWLSDLNWTRNWQQKTILIETRERQPWLIWCLRARTNAKQAQTNAGDLPRQSVKNCYWADEQGMIFSSASEAEGYIIPKVFEENGRQQLILGQPFYNNPQLVKNTLEIVKQVKNSSLAINRFLISNANLQEMETETNGLKLYFSFRFLPRNLNNILIDLADRLDFPKLEYVDFRVENRIYYK